MSRNFQKLNMALSQTSARQKEMAEKLLLISKKAKNFQSNLKKKNKKKNERSLSLTNHTRSSKSNLISKKSREVIYTSKADA